MQGLVSGVSVLSPDGLASRTALLPLSMSTSLSIRPGQFVRITNTNEQSAVFLTRVDTSLPPKHIRLTSQPQWMANMDGEQGTLVAVKALPSLETIVVVPLFPVPAKAGLWRQIMSEVRNLGVVRHHEVLEVQTSPLRSVRLHTNLGSHTEPIHTSASPLEKMWGLITQSTTIISARFPIPPSPSLLSSTATVQDALDTIGPCAQHLLRLVRLSLGIGSKNVRLRELRERIRLKGLLLQGVSGTGKTQAVRVVCAMLGVQIVEVRAGQLFSGGRSLDETLSAAFQTLVALSPAVLLLDNVHVTCPQGSSEVDVQRAIDGVEALIRRVFEAPKCSHCVVVAICTSPSTVHHRILSHFPPHTHVLFELPAPPQRRKILSVVCGGLFRALADDRDVLGLCHSLTGADLAAIASTAARSATPACLDISSRSRIQAPPDPKVLRERFLFALKRYQPPSMFSGSGTVNPVLQVPSISWHDIGGLEEVKEQLKQAVVWPITMKKGLDRLGVSCPTGVLLYGPPGTGKTLLAKAVATETNFNFVSVDVQDIVKGAVGESERAIKRVFDLARRHAPCVVFFDEIQAVFGRRDSSNREGSNTSVSQLLLNLDQLSARHDSTNGTQHGHIAVIASTNAPEVLDPALLRPGRFDRLVYVPPPDARARAEILERLLRQFVLGLSILPASTSEQQRTSESGVEVFAGWLAERTRWYTGADLRNLCSTAFDCAIEREGTAAVSTSPLEMADFEAALTKCKIHLSQDKVEGYAGFSASSVAGQGLTTPMYV